MRRRLQFIPGLFALVVCLGGCAGVTPSDGKAVATRPQVQLAIYAYVDQDFVRRFGDIRHGGRSQVNDWLWEAERQLRTQYPLSLRLMGVGPWQLPAGANDGKRI